MGKKKEVVEQGTVPTPTIFGEILKFGKPNWRHGTVQFNDGTTGKFNRMPPNSFVVICKPVEE